MSRPTDPPRPRRRVGPFVVFGAVAAAAAVGAIYEISYWVGVPAFFGSTIGTTLGIIAALVAFFAFGLTAPANE
jgi:putative flippase GtrA